MKKPFLRILSEQDLKSIHQASLRILGNTGMLVDHAEAIEMLDAAGAKVDHKKRLVRFPPELIEQKLALAPRKVIFHGRTPDYDISLEPGGEVYARMPGGCQSYVDLKTGEHRKGRLEDWKEICRLADALPNIHAIATFYCQDVPKEVANLCSLQVVLEHQRMPITHNADNFSIFKLMLEMLLAVRGSKEELARRPPMNLMVSPIAPLYWNEDDLNQLLLACKYGIPADIPIMPVTGLTGPVTLAGTIALANAEFLGTTVIVQTASPGYSMPYFPIPLAADMKTGKPLFAAPETGLMIAALTQLSSELYGWPSESVGLNSDGYILEQILFQRCQNAAMHSLAGGKLLVGVGSLGGSMALSPAQLVIDNEILNIARRWARGITVNEDTLAVDLIHKVGPRGHFLEEEHTLRHLMAGEQLNVDLFDRSFRDNWLRAGGKNLQQKAMEKAQAILDKHQVEPLPAEVSRELKAIVGKGQSLSN
jgi:trimethylamine--corrinoid protein Co-methyltransferase